MRLLRLLALSASFVALAGCSSSPSTEYLHAKVTSPIVGAAGIPMPMQQPYYRVPKVRVAGKPGPVSLIPPGSRIGQYPS